jgi:hypothetical protein
VEKLALASRRNPYFDAVAGLAESYDPKSYAGGSVATGRVSHVGQDKGDDRDKRNILVPSLGWAWG